LAGPGHHPAGDYLIEAPAAEIPVQRPVRGLDGEGGHPLPPPGQGLLRREVLPEEPGAGLAAPLPGHQADPLPIGQGGGDGLPLPQAVGQPSSPAGEGEPQNPPVFLQGNEPLDGQSGSGQLLLPPGKPGAVGDGTGQPVSGGKGGVRPPVQAHRDGLLPAHGQGVVGPEGQFALPGVAPGPEQARPCLVGEPAKFRIAQHLAPSHRGQTAAAADDDGIPDHLPGGRLRGERHWGRRGHFLCGLPLLQR
jgi:hypothetical protein